MSPLLKKITWTRVIATSACLTALATYALFAPAPAYSAACECKLAGLYYSEGACVGNQSCQCIHFENGACSCKWLNDPNC